MTPIAAALAAVTVGQPKSAGRLTVFPLLGAGDSRPAYLLLDEALAKGVAQVTETSTSGSVPELKFENRSDQPILIVDGEALIGAKQNRIVNISIMVPAQSVTPIPVS
jgi:ARG and Rhodanese-Phosphatase-superfamily-associated Protein domain